MKNKKLILGLVALVALVAALIAIFALTRPAPEDGSKTITVTVVHKDGSSRDFTYTTDEEYLGPVLISEGLVQGEQGPYGLFIQAVDGETADWSVDSGWWNLFVGEEAATTGADAVVITDGGVYKLVYTIG